jgi:hypothetical protein
MKNITIPSGLTAAHGHSGSLDWSPAQTAQFMAFGWPMPPGAGPAHGRRVVTAQCASSVSGMAQRSPAFMWLIGDEVLAYTFHN